MLIRCLVFLLNFVLVCLSFKPIVVYICCSLSLSLCNNNTFVNRDGTGTGDSIVNQLLSKLDGVDALNNVLVIGMTNRKASFFYFFIFYFFLLLLFTREKEEREEREK